jgi:hypothetical protein
MNKTSVFLAIVTGTVLSFPFKALAVEALETAELASHCKNYLAGEDTVDGTFCIRYIQGFIDGAVATDERVTLSVSDEYERDESFTERATRTRIGTRVKQFGASVYAGYCLGDPLPLRDVVKKVIDDLEDEDKVNANPLARDLVYLTLTSQYPCQTDDGSA